MKRKLKLLALASVMSALVAVGCTPEGRAEYEQAGDKAGEAAQETGQAIVTDAANTGEAVGEAAARARVAAAATETTISVKNALLTAENFDAKGIDVDTVGKTVHLKGTVANEENRARAIKIAKLAVGPEYEVIDELKVG